MKGFFLFISFLLFSFAVKAQNNLPGNAIALCDSAGLSYQYAAGTNGGNAFIGPIGCLSSSPNPAWFYFQVGESGPLQFTVASSPARDIDYILWGPFQSLDLTNTSQYNTSNQAACSYSDNTTEFINITNAPAGQYYILLITNYSNQATNISFDQTGGAGSTRCIYAFSNSPRCAGQTLNLQTSLNSSVYQFTWTGPNGFQSTDANPVIPNVTAAHSGTYTFVATNGSDTLEATVDVVVTSPPQPVISGQQQVCVRGRLTTTLSVQPGFQSYSWSGPGLNSTESSVTVGKGTFQVTVTAGGGCSASETVTVTERDTLKPRILGENHICFEEPVTLSTEESYVTYFWSTGDSTATTVITRPNAYNVTVTDEYGCEGGGAVSRYYFVVTQSAPEPQIYGLQAFCAPESITLSTGPFASYEWKLNNNTVGTADTLRYSGGAITLQVTDSYGCRGSATASVVPMTQPQAFYVYTPESPVQMGNVVSFTDKSTSVGGDPIVNWYWEFTPPGPPDGTSVEQSPSYLFADPGSKEAKLVVTTASGCKDTFIVNIQVTDKPVVPNSFSPNGDGTNDHFVIPYLTDYPGNSVVVFNRWGKKVFEASDYQNDWDGGGLPTGTYFYVVSIPSMEEMKGSVTLFREN